MEKGKKNLFERAMKGEWDEVVKQYEVDDKIYSAKITKSNDTALHIAVSDGQEDVVIRLVEIMCKNQDESLARKALLVQNERGDTPLHIAASLGSVKICHCIAQVDFKLVLARNHDNDTPFFLTVLNGKEEAFYCLYHIVHKQDTSEILRGNGGDTILHTAISGEYFNLAFQIIHLYDEAGQSDQPHKLVNARNERGITPLQMLASKPIAFRSGSHLSGYSRIVYHCTFVDSLKVKKRSSEDGSCKQELKETGESDLNKTEYPENCHTLVFFLSLVWRMIEVVIRPSTSKSSRGDTENPQGDTSANKQLFPPNYNTCFELIKVACKAMLIILGAGSSEIRKVHNNKEKHKWAAQLMNELLKRAVMYESEESGGPPPLEGMEGSEGFIEYDQLLGKTDLETLNRKDVPNKTEEIASRLIMVKNDVNDDLIEKILKLFHMGVDLDKKNIVLMAMEKQRVSDMPKVENPILIAAKNGITEMVEKILDKYPVAIHDMDANRKNLVLLAVEHRQPHIYQLLLNRYSKDSKSSPVKDSVFRHVDKDGNSALHLAAMLGDYKPWLIPGAALQMQWELKWHEFVKNSMSYHFFVHHNKAGKTPKDIFSTTHQELVKSGSEWLEHTSNSCSLVAALIATVAFATSATVPGGVKQDIGTPTLEHHPAFNVFAISSLVALCFSITSVIFFLAILTSRHQEKDFRKDLPKKLLMGLSSLFVSIAAILVSFCAGHFFVLKDKLRYAALPVYTVACLPVTLFAIAQFPLYFDLIWATFKKVPQRSYMVVPP